jgi:hypothetical protein
MSCGDGDAAEASDIVVLFTKDVAKKRKTYQDGKFY